MSRMTMGEFLDQIENGLLFGVTFVKKGNGELRNMTARRGVTKGVKGIIPPEVRREEDERNNVLTVYDVNKITNENDVKGAFRRINLDGLKSVRLNGVEWTWDNFRKEFES